MKNKKQSQDSIGNRIKFEREKQGLTRLALAKRSNTTPDYIAQIERSDKNPSLRTFINLLTALNISSDHLIFGRDEQKGDSNNETLDKLTDFLNDRKEEELEALYSILTFIYPYIKK